MGSNAKASQAFNCIAVERGREKLGINIGHFPVKTMGLEQERRNSKNLQWNIKVKPSILKTLTYGELQIVKINKFSTINR